MSERHHSYGKGSSRSARDDSRPHRERYGGGRERPSGRARSRSRSPRRRRSPPRSENYSTERSAKNRDTTEYEDKNKRTPYDQTNDWEDSDEEVPAPPPPPRISKISIGFAKPSAPIKMSLAGASKVVTAVPKPTIASVFNDDDDDDEPEEMPAEARMRMRNIGRETPTSAGPNSFGKTKQGFCDAKKVFEKNLKQALEGTDKTITPKFPQTIYRIKGP